MQFQSGCFLAMLLHMFNSQARATQRLGITLVPTSCTVDCELLTAVANLESDRKSLFLVPKADGATAIAALVHPQQSYFDRKNNALGRFLSKREPQAFWLLLMSAFPVLARVLGGRKSVLAVMAMLLGVGTAGAQATAPAVSFGNVSAGTPSSATVTFTFSVTTAVAASNVLTQGATGLDFQPGTAGTGACTAKSYISGQTCTVAVNFLPMATGLRRGAVTLTDSNGAVLATGLVSGNATGPQAVFYPGTQSYPIVGLPSDAFGMGIDAAGNLYLAQGANIIKETYSGGTYTASTIGSTTSGNGAGAMAVDGAGNVYYSIPGTSTNVLTYNASAKTYTQQTKFTDAGYAVAVDGVGNFYVGGGASLFKETISGGTSYTSSTIRSTYSQIIGLTVDASGNLYIADAGLGGLYKETYSGGTYTQTTIATGLGNANGVAVDPAGNVYVVQNQGSSYASSVLLFAPNGSGGYLSPVPYGTYSRPNGLAIDGAGNLYVTDDGGGQNRVGKYTVSAVSTLGFGTLVVGASSGTAIEALTNIGNANLTSSSVTVAATPASYPLVSGGGYCALAATTVINPAGSCNIGIKFAPTVAGNPETGVYTVTDNSFNASGANQSLPATGAAVYNLVFTSTVPPTLQTGQNAGTVTAALDNSSGSAVSGANQTVTLTVTGPSSYSQTYNVTSTNGVASFNLSGTALTTPGSYSYALSSANSNSPGAASETVYPYKLAIGPGPATPITAGGNAGTVAVQILDNSGNATTQTSTVTLTVAGPSSYAATYNMAAVNGTATFNLSGVTLTVSGTYNYNASSPGLTSAPQVNETVNPGAAVSLTVTASAYTAYVGFPDSFTVKAFDSYGNVATGNGDTITLSSTDAAANLPAPFALVNGTATQPVTFNTGGSQTVTATDSSNAAIASSTSPVVTVKQIPVFTVTTATDDATGTAANCPDQANGGGPSTTCSLRDAFAAVTALSNSGTGTYVPTINFATSLYGQTITMSATSTVNGNVALVGPGAGANAITLSGNNAVTFLSQAASAPITNFSGLTFSNFKGAQSTVLIGSGTFTFTNDTFSNSTYTGTNNGGALGINGAITITGCTFTGNTSAGGGGALATTQTSLTISDSLFNNNMAVGSGGAISTYGSGAISFVNTAFLTNKATGGGAGGAFYQNSAAPLTITNGTFNGNTATALGGAIYELGLLNISGSSFSANQTGSSSTAFGGAIFNQYAGATGTIASTNFIGNKAVTSSIQAYGGALYVDRVNLTNVLFSGNSASSTSTVFGGAVYFTGPYASALTGVTFFGNSTTGTAATQYGGALYQVSSTLNLYNTTVTGNSAKVGGGVYKSSGVLNLYNSVVSGNTATTTFPDISTSVTNNATAAGNSYYNFASAMTCATNCFPVLSALGSYGGGTVGAAGYTTPVMTMIPLPGSPLLAAGSTANLNGATTDARGIPNNRTLSEAGATHVDIGAAEANYSLAFVKQPVNAEVGASDISTVQLYESNNLFAPGVATGTLGLTSAAAQSSATVTMSASGLETINAKYNAVTPGDTLTAAVQNYGSTLTLASVTSNPFNVTSPTGATEGALLVEGFPASTSAGVAKTIRVTAFDTTGAVFAGYVGTVTLTSSDANAVLPAPYTFTAADAGVHTFTVTLKTGGTQSITASDGTFTASETGIFVVQEYVFVVNSGGTVTTTSANGTVQASAVAGGGIGAAVDASGYVWSINAGGNGVSKFTDTGALSNSYSGPSAATAIAIGGLGNVFFTNGNGTINALTNAGAMLYNNPVAAAAGISSPTALSVDSSGSLWIASSGDNSAVEIIGIAAPVVAPTVNAVRNANPGTRP